MTEVTRRTAVKVGLAAAALPLAGIGEAAAAEPQPGIDAALRQGVERGDVPGVVAMAATDKGILYEGAFGRRSLAGDAPMTLDTTFLIHSMTKAVTSVAAMQQVEKGKLQLDAPMSGVMPDIATVQVLDGFDAAGAPRLRPPRRPVTLRHLLTHTAGFGYDVWNEDLRQYQAKTGLPRIGTGKAAALRLPLTFDPGERWQYGINIDWVGRAVETVSGERLNDYFRAHIFAPLGMTDTSYTPGPDQQARLATAHERQADGSLKVSPAALPASPDFHFGGGGLVGTAPDYMAFLRMLLHGGRFNGAEILRPDTVALMGQNQIGDIQAGIMKTAMPPFSNDVDFFPGMAQRWGLAYLMNMQPSPAGRSAGSLAWAGLRNTYFWLDPTTRVAGVIMTQILPFADHKAVGLYGEFERAVYAVVA